MNIFYIKFCLKGLFLRLRLEAEGLRTFPDAFFQIKFLIIQNDLPLLHPRHIQYVINQPQKLPAGIIDLIQISGGFIRLIAVLTRQL